MSTCTIEQNIIAAILNDNDCLDLIDGQLNENDFSDKRNAFLFKTIIGLVGSGEYIDVITLASILADRYGDRGSKIQPYLAEINQNASTSKHNIAHHAKTIREAAIVRGLQKVADDILAMIDNRDGKDVGELLIESDNLMQSIISGHSDNNIKLYNMNEMQNALITDMQEALKRKGLIGICTGIKRLNLKTNGLQRGTMVIVAGPASMGKTTFAMNLVKRAAETQKYPTVVFSMEMPFLDIIRRYLSSSARVNYQRLLTNNDWDDKESNKFTVGLGRMSSHKLLVCDNATLTTSLIRSTLKRVKREYGGVSCAMIDYVQMIDAIKSQANNRNAELTIISRELKKIAREFGIPFLVLSQLSKDVEKAQRKPTNGDLRESGALAQDADMVLMVHRESKYNPNSENEGLASILITKNRNGECGECVCGFDGSTFTFYDLES
jgi:replicative DNA helicase